MMDKNSTILITGGSGMMGHHLFKELENAGFTNIINPDRKELNLLNIEETKNYIKQNKPDYVFHFAALVYGLGGNLKNQIESLYQNSLINLNLLYSLSDSNVKKVFFAGTVSSYPYPFESLPLKEEQIFFGKPHAGEYGYAVAKNLGYQFLEILKKEVGIDYCVGLFTNLFGEYDRFDIKTGHVVPSLIHKMYLANKNKTDFEIWGDGSATRDYCYAGDAAKAALFLIDNYSGIINISSGQETSMKELAEVLVSTSGFTGNISWKKDAPVGIPRRYADNSKLKALGFNDFMPFDQAMAVSYQWFEKNYTQS